MPQAPHGGLMCPHQFDETVTVEMAVPDGRVVAHHDRGYDVTFIEDQTNLIERV